ncbi:hypothetical protein A6R68_07492 [Neotoma lepida]|uniref:Uncharacterized protein n=1 Tax=Neotoma lepida TaxID=56216 RepID=A0A1A6GDP1_NEOLE|nr:hypothetical protein A6R68_07492 [Neotoma lepida]
MLSTNTLSSISSMLSRTKHLLPTTCLC